MALFTDGGITQISELEAYDSALLRVANAEGVDLTAKQNLAGSEIGIAIEEFLVRRTGMLPSSDPASGQALGNVVVTPPLKQWHTLLTLSLVYSDVEGNHVKGRYAEKAQEYRRRAKWAAETLFRIGVGLTFRPIPRATQPVVRTVSGAEPVETYSVEVAWRNSAGESGAPSEALVYTTETAGVIGVTAAAASAAVTGFDVYVGLSDGELTRQNSEMVARGAEWVMPAGGLVAGAPLPAGQSPDRYVRNDRVLRRG